MHFEEVLTKTLQKIQELSNTADGTTSDSIARLAKRFNDFGKCPFEYTRTKDFFRALMEYLVVIVDFAQQVNSNDDYFTVVNTVRYSLKVIMFVIETHQILDLLVKKSGKILRMISAEYLKVTPIKEIIKMYNKFLTKANEETLEEVGYKYISICETLFNAITQTSDVELQFVTVEVIFRLCRGTVKKEQLFLETPTLKRLFAAITTKHLHRGIREFLNVYNDKSGNIFSVTCSKIMLDSEVINGITEMGETCPMFLDFSLAENKISFFCTAGTLPRALQEPFVDWNLISFLSRDVLKTDYTFRRHSNGGTFIIEIKIKESSFYSIPTTHFSKIHSLTISISELCDTFDYFFKNIISQMFPVSVLSIKIIDENNDEENIVFPVSQDIFTSEDLSPERPVLDSSIRKAMKSLQNSLVHADIHQANEHEDDYDISRPLQRNKEALGRQERKISTCEDLWDAEPINSLQNSLVHADIHQANEQENDYDISRPLQRNKETLGRQERKISTCEDLWDGEPIKSLQNSLVHADIHQANEHEDDYDISRPLQRNEEALSRQGRKISTCEDLWDGEPIKRKQTERVTFSQREKNNSLMGTKKFSQWTEPIIYEESLRYNSPPLSDDDIERLEKNQREIKKFVTSTNTIGTIANKSISPISYAELIGGNRSTALSPVTGIDLNQENRLHSLKEQRRFCRSVSPNMALLRSGYPHCSTTIEEDNQIKNRNKKISVNVSFLTEDSQLGEPPGRPSRQKTLSNKLSTSSSNSTANRVQISEDFLASKYDKWLTEEWPDPSEHLAANFTNSKVSYWLEHMFTEDLSQDSVHEISGEGDNQLLVDEIVEPAIFSPHPTESNLVDLSSPVTVFETALETFTTKSESSNRIRVLAESSIVESVGSEISGGKKLLDSEKSSPKLTGRPLKISAHSQEISLENVIELNDFEGDVDKVSPKLRNNQLGLDSDDDIQFVPESDENYLNVEQEIVVSYRNISIERCDVNKSIETNDVNGNVIQPLNVATGKGNEKPQLSDSCESMDYGPKSVHTSSENCCNDKVVQECRIYLKRIDSEEEIFKQQKVLEKTQTLYNKCDEEANVNRNIEQTPNNTVDILMKTIFEHESPDIGNHVTSVSTPPLTTQEVLRVLEEDLESEQPSCKLKKKRTLYNPNDLSYLEEALAEKNIESRKCETLPLSPKKVSKPRQKRNTKKTPKSSVRQRTIKSLQKQFQPTANNVSVTGASFSKSFDVLYKDYTDCKKKSKICKNKPKSATSSPSSFEPLGVAVKSATNRRKSTNNLFTTAITNASQEEVEMELEQLINSDEDQKPTKRNKRNKKKPLWISSPRSFDITCDSGEDWLDTTFPSYRQRASIDAHKSSKSMNLRSKKQAVVNSRKIVKSPLNEISPMKRKNNNNLSKGTETCTNSKRRKYDVELNESMTYTKENDVEKVVNIESSSRTDSKNNKINVISNLLLTSRSSCDKAIQTMKPANEHSCNCKTLCKQLVSTVAAILECHHPELEDFTKYLHHCNAAGRFT